MSDASIRLLVFLCKTAAENYILDPVIKSQHVFTRMNVVMRSDVAAKAMKISFRMRSTLPLPTAITFSVSVIGASFNTET